MGGGEREREREEKGLNVQSNLSNPGSVGPTGARMCENAHNSEYSTEETDC